ncbi:MAG: hypothetical protein WKF66_12930 [Pedobacter sp.]
MTGKYPLLCVFLTTISTAIVSCSSSSNDSIPASKEASKFSKEEVKNVVSNFKEAIPLDSTTVILYPLTFSVAQKDEDEVRSYSSSPVGGPYWNIAFYDTKTGVSKLLASGPAIRINSFQKMKDVMIYSVTSIDYDGDGELNEHDPIYLYISDLAGNYFRQVTPDSIHVSSFQSIDKSNFLLIQAQIDSSKDKKFGSNDPIVPMIFDIKKDETARNTFSSAFTAEVNGVFNKTYKN